MFGRPSSSKTTRKAVSRTRSALSLPLLFTCIGHCRSAAVMHCGTQYELHRWNRIKLITANVSFPPLHDVIRPTILTDRRQRAGSDTGDSLIDKCSSSEHLLPRAPFSSYVRMSLHNFQDCLSQTIHYYCTDPDVTWGRGRGCPLVVHYLADLQSGHGLRCYGNITRTLVTSLRPSRDMRT